MSHFQALFLFCFTAYVVVSFAISYHYCVHRRNPFGLAKLLLGLGAFVWGDGVVLGLFWMGVVGAVSYLQNWNLFLFIVSLFWFVRSWGEVQYWLLEQFSDKVRNTPETLLFHNYFAGDSIWFVYQVFWQCVMVVSGAVTVYFGSLLF